MRTVSAFLCLLALLLSGFAGIAHSQDLAAVELEILPNPESPAPVVRCTDDGVGWLVFRTGGAGIELAKNLRSWKLSSGGSIAIWDGKPGESFAVVFITESLQLGMTTLTVAGNSPDPQPVDPVITRFAAEPPAIEPGETSRLSWLVQPSTATVLLDGVAVAASGAKQVSPESTTQYTLTATVGTKSVQKTAEVQVRSAPLPIQGLHALIVERTADRGDLSASQRDVLLATDAGSVREWLVENCKSADGDATWRVVDADSDFSLEAETWKTVWNYYSSEHAGKTPWMIVSDGQDFYDGELPADRAETLKILRRFE